MFDHFIVKICACIIVLFLCIFIFYLIFIRPVIVGTYMPSEKECSKAYQCQCLKDSCICTYKKWWKENKLTCDKKILQETQLN